MIIPLKLVIVKGVSLDVYIQIRINAVSQAQPAICRKEVSLDEKDTREVAIEVTNLSKVYKLLFMSPKNLGKPNLC